MDATRMTGAEGALADPRLAGLAGRLAGERPLAEVSARTAAVAAILRVTDAPELLFIRRAEVPHDPWSGHMAFPGGRHEPGDATLAATAIRETYEEVGIDLGRRGRVLGTLDDLAPRSPRLPPLTIRPFVAVVAPDVEPGRSDEVADAMWVRIDALRDPTAATEHLHEDEPGAGRRLRFPGYRVGEHVVWGLTERIVRQLLGVLP